MMAANFGQKIAISMKSTNMPVSILPKTKSFKVSCVSIANYGVNHEKSEIDGLPGVLKMLTMEGSKKPNLTISVRQLLFIMGLYYSTLNNDIIHYHSNTNAGADCFFFVCLFSYANTTQFRTMKWLGHRIGPKTRIGISMSRILIAIFLWYLPLSTCICCVCVCVCGGGGGQ